jgi:Protein of unknown function (DUF2009)
MLTARIQREIKEKERAIEIISKRYGKRVTREKSEDIMDEEEVKQVLYAVGDNHGTPLSRSLAPPHPYLRLPVEVSACGGVFVEGVLWRVLTVAYLRMNEEPVSRMRDMLHQYFAPDRVERDFSLAISTGRNGARLTHNHARQFQFGISPPLPSTPNPLSSPSLPRQTHRLPWSPRFWWWWRWARDLMAPLTGF